MAFLLSQDDDDPERDSETAEGQEYVEALIGSSGDNALYSDQEFRCVATAIVDAVGLVTFQNVGSPQHIRENSDDGLRAMGIEISEEQGNAIFEGAQDCGVDFRDAMRSSLQDSGYSDEELACFDQAVDDDLLRRSVVASFTEDEDAGAATEEELVAAEESCVAD